MNKIDFILLFDATDANPNGDPDAGNLPRIDPETCHGLVTDVCLKRKIRNYVQLTKDGQPNYEIFVKEKAVLNQQQERAYIDKNIKASNKEQPGVKEWMCEHFYDIRTFGAVMTTEVNCGQVRGPVQISFSRSINEITQLEHTVTRCAVTNQGKEDKERTMGRKYTIPYGLYMAKGVVNPYLAEQTGFNEEDLKLLIEALTHMFDFDASAARPAGSMTVRKLILFKHDSMLGNAPAHKLYDSVKVTKKPGIEFPRSIEDYDIVIPGSDEIPGVKVEVLE